MLVFFSSVLFATTLKADCIACWSTQYVKIEYNNGNTKIGFILWNKSWCSFVNHNDLEIMTDYCDTIYSTFRTMNSKLVLYNEIKVFSHILPRTPIALNKFDTINLDFIQGIEKVEHVNNNLIGAAKIEIINDREENLLNRKAIAKIETAGSGLSVAHYFSFSRNIREEELKLFSSGKIDIETDSIVILEIHYD